MSRKVAVFKSVIRQPQTLSSFVVLMPLAPTSAIICTECELPQETYSEDVITVNGQPVYYPTRAQVSGTWECTFEESIDQVAAPSIALLRGLVRAGQEGTANFQNVAVQQLSESYFNKHIRMLFTDNLLRNAVYFTKFTTFVPVQDIVISLLRSDGTLSPEILPVNTVILRAAWLQSVQPLSLGADKATSPLKYRLKFRYSAIKHLTSI